MARTESAFREVNEAIATTAARFDAEGTDFVCECADPACAHRLTAELDDYEEVRSRAARASCSRRVTRSRRSSVSSSGRGEYDVVEKFGPRCEADRASSSTRAQPSYETGHDHWIT